MGLKKNTWQQASPAHEPIAILLQALHKNPADETTWLALADALEENGQPECAILTRLGRRLRSLPEGDERVATQQQAQTLLKSGVWPCVPTVINSLGMVFALVPAGTFWMGSPKDEPERHPNEGPLHEVEISKPFYMGVTPVTQEQYQIVMGNTPSSHSATGNASRTTEGLDTRSFPVECLSWQEATTFCRELSRLSEEHRANRHYRLPTEAQWEYACRATTRTPYHFGVAITPELTNFKGTNLYRTCPVGIDVPNLFGLHDLHGNVLEWCSDWYSKNYYFQSCKVDPQGPSRRTCRVLRGGSYCSYYQDCRAAARPYNPPELVSGDQGFRVILLFQN